MAKTRTAAQQEVLNERLWQAADGKVDVPAVKKALQEGADANTTVSGLPILVMVADRGSIDAVIALLEAGADVNAVSGGNGRGEWTALKYAAYNGHDDIIKVLLEAGAEVNARKNKDQSTALHSAAFSGYDKSAKLLLAAGADPRLINSSGETPAKSARRMRHPVLADYLAAAEAWHTHIRPLLGPDNKLDAGQLVDDKDQPTEAMKNMPHEVLTTLTKPGLYRQGMDGVAKIYSHLPPAVQASIDLTDWRLSKLKELETEPSAVQRYVRRRPSPLEKGRGNDEPQAGR